MAEMNTKLGLPAEIVDADTLEEAALRLGILLELPTAAPLAATRRALDQPEYARGLVASRKIPTLRDRLLAAADPAPVPSSAGLIGKAASSVLKWGMDGLRPAEPWVIQKRLAACQRCEFLAPAPDSLVYRGAKVAVGPNARICTSCHCLVNTKAAISTEKCPEPAPGDPAQSRWGEPWVAPSEHPEGPW